MARKRQFEIDIDEVSKFYTITPDGRVYSLIKNRWLKPIVNNYGYINYSINKGVPHYCFVSAHRLVAMKYISPPPSPKHEVDHIDNDKTNNDHTNLRWVTHSENQIAAFRRGRKCYWSGKTKPSPGIETRRLMSNAKNKPIYNWSTGEVYKSIYECCEKLNTNRTMVYRALKKNRPIGTNYLSFISEIPPEL